MPTKPWQRPRDTLSLAHDMSGGRPTLRDFRRVGIRAADGVRASLHSENTLSFRRVVPTLRKQCSVGQPILRWLTDQRPEAGPAPQRQIVSVEVRGTYPSRRVKCFYLTSPFIEPAVIRARFGGLQLP